MAVLFYQNQTLSASVMPGWRRANVLAPFCSHSPAGAGPFPCRWPLWRAGAPEITPAMLAAGVQMIAEEWEICGADIAPDLARDVFKAMWVARKDQEQS